jgi:MOSC domain-containing protein YiiM
VRSYDELERLWREAPPASCDRGVVRLICVRKGQGAHECPDRVALSPETGVAGDRWIDKPERKLGEQVTLMSARVAELVAGAHAPLHAAGDNFLVELDLTEASLPAGTRLRLGSALLEVSREPHTGCKKFRERFGMDALRWVNDHKPLRLRGVNCRIVAAGEVGVGDAIEVVV